MAHESIIQITPDNLDEVSSSGKPVVLKFYNDY